MEPYALRRSGQRLNIWSGAVLSLIADRSSTRSRLGWIAIRSGLQENSPHSHGVGESIRPFDTASSAALMNCIESHGVWGFNSLLRLAAGLRWTCDSAFFLAGHRLRILSEAALLWAKNWRRFPRRGCVRSCWCFARNMRRSLCGRTCLSPESIAGSTVARAGAICRHDRNDRMVRRVDEIAQIARRDRPDPDSRPVRARFQFNRFNAFDDVVRDTISLMRSVSKRTA
jgi:hypothetical protein